MSLGDAYEKGLGVDQSYEKAAECYQKVADDDDPRGLVALGNMYENGLGFRQSDQRAFEM